MNSSPAACAGCGEPEPATGSYFVSAYPPFDFWTTAELPAYRQALERPGDPTVPLGLYVHIPFCEQRCDYCYYLSYDGRSSEVDDYLTALEGEVALYATTPAVDSRNLDFAYIGGGTPSLLSTSRLERLLRSLETTVGLGAAREITFECAPRSVTPEKLDLLRAFGVNRISMGVQQLDDRILRLNGRLHLVADITRAVELIQQADFPILNLDLIVGLLGESDESFFSSLERTLTLDAESLTLYQLEIPHNTPLFRNLDRGEAADLPDWTAKRRRLSLAFARLEERGYTLRSAYTAVRDAQRQPFLYQDLLYQGADLIGLGASSFSYLDGVHQQNIASLSGYLGSYGGGKLPLGRAYALSAEEQLIRQVVLQLKLGGVDLAALEEKFAVDVRRRFAETLASLEGSTFVETAGGQISVTREGLLRIDRLLPFFYRAVHRPELAPSPA